MEQTNAIQHPELSQVRLSPKQAQLRRLEQLFGIEPNDTETFEVETETSQKASADFWKLR